MKSRQLLKQIKMLERVLKPAPPTDVEIVTLFPWNPDQPHGEYGTQITNITTRESRAVSPDEERLLLKQYYDEHVPDHCKQNPEHVWYTFERFLEYHRCKCGKHFPLHR